MYSWCICDILVTYLLYLYYKKRLHKRAVFRKKILILFEAVTAAIAQYSSNSKANDVLVF